MSKLHHLIATRKAPFLLAALAHIGIAAADPWRGVFVIMRVIELEAA